MGANASVAATQLRKCSRALRELASVPSRAARPISDELRKLLEQQFETGRDPYGRPWKSLAPSTIRRKGHSQINVDTGHTRDDMIVRPAQGAGVEVIFTTPYAKYIQKVRPLFPSGPIPASWARAFEAVFAQLAARAINGSGARGKPR